MTRRPFLILGSTVAAVFVVLATFYYLRPRSLINSDTCDRIENGMSEGEVEAILGGPQGNCHTRQVDIHFTDAILKQKGRRAAWIGNEGTAFVFFDQNNRVVATEFAPALPRDESILDIVRRWLRLSLTTFPGRRPAPFSRAVPALAV